MKVYCLVRYEYNSFSYSGIIENETFIHATKEGAIAHAEELGLKIVNCCDNADKEATLHEQELLP